MKVHVPLQDWGNTGFCAFLKGGIGLGVICKKKVLMRIRQEIFSFQIPAAVVL